MAQPLSLRYFTKNKPSDQTEVSLITSGSSITFTGIIYSASETPFSQGIEIKSIANLTDYTALKIRGNHNFITTLDNVIQDQDFYNDLLSIESMGMSSTGSQVSLDTQGRISQVVHHVAEKRDIGQTSIFNDSTPFIDPDPFHIDSTIILTQHPLDLSVPFALVQAGDSYSSFDGVIEPLDIRKIVDRSSIELPYVAHSIKSDNSVTNEKRESIIVNDRRDVVDSGTRPFLDSQETFGNIDLPGAFSDADPRINPFLDSTTREEAYDKNKLDVGIRSALLTGFVSASLTYRAVRTENVTNDEIVSRHGFDFSQNDNYSYDSIAFGGLKK